MRRAVLLSNPETKRAVYLQKAAIQEQISLHILDWKDWKKHLPDGELFLKIDPPLWDSCILEELDMLTEAYERELEAAAYLTEERTIEFLNTPAVITELLDKRSCKKRLIQAGLPVTEFLGADSEDHMDHAYRNMEELLEAMKRCQVYQIFLKPVRGSGAAGVTAFRLQPGTGRMSLYTCALHVPEKGILNTKRLRNYTDVSEIQLFLNKILKTDCIAERWHPKAAVHGFSYDLRVVVQDGNVDYVLARLSKGPVTNLQLNNHPMSLEDTGLSLQTQEKIKRLCVEAAACYPGLGTVGIDILLEKGSLNPRIIEMNAQGDLIYQDIYHENSIYRHQARKIKAWLSG